MADFCDKLKSGVLWIVRWDNRVGTKIIFIVMCSLFLISWFSGIFRVLGNNLGLNQWDYIACVIALCSMCMAILTFISQQNTERNTMKITPKGQMGLLMDYVRHFYTNMVITLAIEHKMDGKYKKAYPSQEHLLKLKADLEALHPEAFVQNEEQYKQIHNLLILIRNYNTEVDVAIMHLTDKSIDKDVKKRSFDTLRLKPGLISDRIMECIGNIWGRDAEKCMTALREDIVEEAYKRENLKSDSVEDVAKMNEMINGLGTYYYGEKPNEENGKPLSDKYRDNGFVKNFFRDDPSMFYKLLNVNVRTMVEGRNSEDSPKIMLIPFHNHRLR